jgi:HAD superfamily hydrolase (TIGR01509 family)
MTDIKTIKGIIFDADGTLLDSMSMWATVEADYLRSLGLKPRPDLVRALRSLSLNEVAMYFQSEYGVRKSLEEINSEKNGMIEEFYYKKAQLKEGVVPVLEALSARGVKMCIATATDKYLVEAAIERCGIMGYFGKIFTCGEERTSKSSPDIFFTAAAFLGTETRNTLVVEDALYAMKSAKGAGFPVAGVYDQTSDDEQDEIKELCDFYWETVGGMLGSI